MDYSNYLMNSWWNSDAEEIIEPETEYHGADADGDNYYNCILYACENAHLEVIKYLSQDYNSGPST